MIQVEKWQKDLAVYQDINTTFIIEGNVHDLQPWTYEDDGTCEPVALSLYLHRYLTEAGYDPVIFYNRIDGFSNPYSSDMSATFFRGSSSDEKSSKSIGVATELIRKTMVDTYLVNPLSMVLIREELQSGDIITIEDCLPGEEDLFSYNVQRA